MDKYVKRKFESKLLPLPEKGCDSSKKSHVDINLEDLPLDPGLRPWITDYNSNNRDQIHGAYLQICQSHNHKFSQKRYGVKLRRFNKA